MIRKYHKHTLQTNPREEQQNIKSNKKIKAKQPALIFLVKMIAKLESYADQNKDQTQSTLFLFIDNARTCLYAEGL